MQGCLASGYPFVLGFSVYESFMSPEVAKTGEVPLPPRGEQLIGGHAVVAVGYDDSIQRFIVRNSWGTGWGMKGYCTMPYGYLTDPQLARDFWASYGGEAEQLLAEPAQQTWRNQFYDAVRPGAVDAVIAFGANAQAAFDLWPHKPDVPVERIPHPSSRDEAALLREWHDAITRLRQKVTPDPDGNAGGPNYGSSFAEADYAPIPRRDLPFGVPDFLGDDAVGRQAHPRHNNCVSRPSPDDGRTLIWKAPLDGSP